MPDIHITDVQTGLPQIIEHVLAKGSRIEVKGEWTREVVDVGIVLYKPSNCLATDIGRNMNKALAAVEALQLIGGVSHPDLMGRIAPNTLQFRDGGAFNGAYGPRIGMQLPLVVERLADDPTSRQAIVTIWDPLHDLVRKTSRDFPCTLSFQFLIRGGELDMITTMRSNDVWWGFTYDVVQFTQLQCTVANALGVPPGAYRHRAGSLHVYERDFDAIKDVGFANHAPDMLHGLGSSGTSIEDSMNMARRILRNETPGNMTPTERWLQDAIRAKVPLWSV